jgi:hypothetical protein
MLILPIFNEKIQNYVSHHKHLNIMHHVEMTIVTPKANHSSMSLGSQFATFGLNVVAIKYMYSMEFTPMLCM